jgi:hypothetical protein
VNAIILIHQKVNYFVLEIKRAHHLLSTRLYLLLRIHTWQVYYLKDKHLMPKNV